MFVRDNEVALNMCYISSYSFDIQDLCFGEIYFSRKIVIVAVKD